MSSAGEKGDARFRWPSILRGCKNAGPVRVSFKFISRHLGGVISHRVVSRGNYYSKCRVANFRHPGVFNTGSAKLFLKIDAGHLCD